MGNCLFLRAQGWGIDRQVRTKLRIPGGMPGGGMVTGRIEPCITETGEQMRFMVCVEKISMVNSNVPHLRSLVSVSCIEIIVQAKILNSVFSSIKQTHDGSVAGRNKSIEIDHRKPNR